VEEVRAKQGFCHGCTDGCSSASRLKLWVKPNPPTPFPGREGGKDLAPLTHQKRGRGRGEKT